MFSVKFKGIDRLVRDLRVARQRAIPHAIRETLNGLAFEAQKEWRDEVTKTFTTRNQFTERSIRVEKARGTDARRLEAKVGTVAPYGRQIEEGGRRRGLGAHKPIPTNVARIGRSPSKLVRAAAKLTRIQAARAPKGSSSKQRNAIALALARKQGKKFAVLETRRGKSLFQVGARKAPRMVWDLTKRSISVSAHPTLGPALKGVAPKAERIAQGALLKQLRRHRVFGY